MKDLTISELPNFHSEPDGYYYEIEEFKRNVVSIWICSRSTFIYNNNEPSKSIWGFYSIGKGKYYSPINSKTVGKEVDINKTTPYSAMIPLQNPLEAAFV